MSRPSQRRQSENGAEESRQLQLFIQLCFDRGNTGSCRSQEGFLGEEAFPQEPER
jgi:hypothetical protein